MSNGKPRTLRTDPSRSSQNAQRSQLLGRKGLQEANDTFERDGGIDEQRARQPAEPPVQRTNRRLGEVGVVAASIDLLGIEASDRARHRFREPVDAPSRCVIGGDPADEMRLVPPDAHEPASTGRIKACVNCWAPQ